ncbi:DNRLRE domain-containing protein [Streptomyces sp. CC208A]|uniref:DNRLRE domain-containing protein n=1 Tax=Streptomyces sp. CC208A TaxID=3044573 RepID=UPI0024A80380|nr:DNRLRE domain-containing protein [Streptomyces sp. CC208A]
MAREAESDWSGSTLVFTRRKRVVSRIALTVVAALGVQSAVTVAASGQAVALSKDLPAAVAEKAGAGGVATEAKNLASAQVAARLSGERVEVLGERTESTTTWANPDGSVTLEAAAGPVRFQDERSGEWRDVDVELVERADGSVAGKAHPLDLTLAGKTATARAAEIKASGRKPGDPKTPAVPLVTLDDGDGKEMTVSWHGALPAPEVDGTEARYADAMPYTDLIVESTRTGFEQFLELKDRRAVDANGTVNLSLVAKGLKAEANADGSVTFVDGETGRKAGLLPAPVMWDAQVDPRSGEHTHTAKVGLKVAQRGNRIDLTLTPDAAFLADPATKFPVTVDPAVNIGAGFDTFVQQGYTTDQSAATELKLGNNGSGQVARSFLAFPMATIKGKQITAAKLNLWNHHSWSCTAKSWEVWDTSSASTSTRWTAQPNWNRKWATSTATKGFSSSCADGWVSTDITTLAQAWAANGNGTNTLGVRATDETDPYGWKRFNSANAASNTPYLSVTYTSYPAVPTALAVDPSQVNAYNGKRYVTSLTPQLSAKVSDPDGGTVSAQFEVTPDPAYNDAGTYGYTATTAAVASGGTAKLTVPADKAFPAGSHLRYRARAYDGGLYSGWTGYTAFVLNTAKPAAPSIVCDAYPKDIWSDKSATGARCTLDTTSTDGQGYLWGLDDPAVPNRIDDTANGTGGDPQTVTVNPADGWHTLYARTVDSGGNLSTATTAYSFGVGADGAALLTPGEGERPARRVGLSAKGKSDYTGVTYQYRRGETDTWKNVPVAHVTKAADGSAVTAWPVATASGVSPQLTWNVTDTLAEDGPIDVRAAFSNGTGTGYTQANTVTVDRDAGTAPLGKAGPGTVNLLTGDLGLSATDASAFDMSVFRTASSRRPAAGTEQEGQAPIFGPEWVSGTVAEITESQWTLLRKTSDTAVALVDAEGEETGFTATNGGGWKPEPGAEHLTLTGSLTGSFTLKDTEGITTTFTRVDPAMTAWNVSSTYLAADNSTTTVVSTKTTVGGKTMARPKWVIAPTSAVPAATCETAPATKGCRVLEYVYPLTTTATDTAFGDYVGRVKLIRLWATAPGADASTSVSVAAYHYDATGRLRQAWDPRVSPSLKTEYTYDTAGRVVQLTPPGELPWTFTYGKAGNAATAGDGMLLKASRAGLKQGTADTVEGTATTSVVYDVPLTGATAPQQMGIAQVKAWGQTDAPTDATAVFPADVTPAGHAGSALTAADYRRAVVTYTNASGREVNSAQPGGGITTTEYDRFGNTVRELTATNRTVALGLTAADKSVQADLGITPLTTAERAELLSTRVLYNDTGTRQLQQFGPLRRISLTKDLVSGGTTLLTAGTSVAARAWTVNEYDGGRPTDGTAKIADQITRSVTGAQIADFPALHAETRTTQTVYDWVKGLPTKTVQDPSGLALTTTTEYDAQGRVTKQLLPGATGTDAATRVTTYWTATGTGTCAGRPEWADLVCSTGPAGAVTGGGTNPSQLPTVVTEYDRWGAPAKATETANGVVRTTTVTVDNAGRPLQTSMTGGAGQAVPTATTEYDPATGRAVRTTSPTGGTITRQFDRLGRVIAYTDADGGVTRTEYDLLNRPVRVSDSVPSTVGYTYDHASEPGGMATSMTDSVAGTFSVRYDADGGVTEEKLPGGYTLTVDRDTTGTVRGRTYVRDSDGLPVFSDAVDESVHGQVTGHVGWSSQQYRYDAAGRLTVVEDETEGICTRRAYGFDKRTNRTSLTSAPGAEGAACPTTGGTTTTHTYDSADRIVDSGYAYDAFGRTTALPGTQVEYHANDLVHRQTAGTVRQTWQLDAAQRFRSWTVEQDEAGTWTTTAARLNHFADDGDSPRWIVEDTTGGDVTRLIDSVTGDLAATTGAEGGTVLQLTTVHGDVALQLPLDPADAPLALDNDEYGNPRPGQPATRYGWLGAAKRSAETPAGLTLMGVRLYNPATGRFTTPDPVYGASANAYEYALGDPVNGYDLDGRKPTKTTSWKRISTYWVNSKWYKSTYSNMPRPLRAFFQGIQARFFLGVYIDSMLWQYRNRWGVWERYVNGARKVKRGKVTTGYYNFADRSRITVCIPWVGCYSKTSPWDDGRWG